MPADDPVASTVDGGPAAWVLRLRRMTRRGMMSIICAVLLVGMAIHFEWYFGGTDFDGYHAQAAEAVGSMPLQFDAWMARDLSPALPDIPGQSVRTLNARKLLRFHDFSPAAFGFEASPASGTRSTAPQPPAARRFAVGVWQVRNGRELAAFDPLLYYASTGFTLLSREDRTLDVPDLRHVGDQLEVTEFRFARQVSGGFAAARHAGTIDPFADPKLDLLGQRVVLAFLLVPGEGVTRDLQVVRRRAEEYPSRNYGAAAVHLIFDLPRGSADGPLARERQWRDDVAVRFMSHAAEGLPAILDTDTQ